MVTVVSSAKPSRKLLARLGRRLEVVPFENDISRPMYLYWCRIAGFYSI